MAERIRVNAPNNEHYDIVIESGILRDGKRLAREFRLDKRVAVVTNDTIAPLHGDALAAVLPDATVITMPDGEQFKTMDTVTDLCRKLAAAGLDRGSTVIALGGGVVGDTAGFAAACYMRGVRLVQVPTSLLAMVDSSVGAKVGVDLPEGKNLVGAFKQPAAVIIDPNVIDTLPEFEWQNGMSETLKHGLLADADLLDPALHTRDRAAELVRRAVQVKVDVVEQDPYEQGIRQHLNLGHTFAHAIERVLDYQMAHGQAVSVGLVLAAELSAALSMCEDELPQQVRSVLQGVGLPVTLPDVDPVQVWDAMSTDKKWRGGRSRFVLLHGVTQPVVVEDVSRDVVIKVMEAAH